MNDFVVSDFDKVFMSYNKILKLLNILNVKTKTGKEITHTDLRQAVLIMLKKHPKCRWRSTRHKSRRYLILYEGYLWLRYVYFQNEMKQIDADIDFFEFRINEYEKVLELEHKNLFDEDISAEDLESYFERKPETIRKSIYKMINYNPNLKYAENDKSIISKEGIEWLCKNCFKQKYLEMLEEYKMELTEKQVTYMIIFMDLIRVSHINGVCTNKSKYAIISLKIVRYMKKI